jgi:hypothetical protein
VSTGQPPFPGQSAEMPAVSAHVEVGVLARSSAPPGACTPGPRGSRPAGAPGRARVEPGGGSVTPATAPPCRHSGSRPAAGGRVAPRIAARPSRPRRTTCSFCCPCPSPPSTLGRPGRHTPRCSRYHPPTGTSCGLPGVTACSERRRATAPGSSRRARPPAWSISPPPRRHAATPPPRSPRRRLVWCRQWCPGWYPWSPAAWRPRPASSVARCRVVCRPSVSSCRSPT